MQYQYQGLDIRMLVHYDEMLEAETLQAQTWGAADVVPATMQRASQKVGGIVAGAFEASGRLVGLVYGITGPMNGQLAHWSHMLAVKENWRDRGLGRVLKQYQRLQLLDQGVTTMYWTCDPLESRNAHFNINRLGARVDQYVCDMYGGGTDTPNVMFSVIGTDRFIFRWVLDDADVDLIMHDRFSAQSGEAEAAPIVNSHVDGKGQVRPAERPLPDAPGIRIEIHPDIQSLKHAVPDEAMAWREVTRRAFLYYLSIQYTVTGFYRDRNTGRCYYNLKQS